MHKLSLKALVQLDLAAFVFVLLSIPFSYLIDFIYAGRPHKAAYAVLIMAPILAGFACDWLMQRRIHRGILDDTWTRTQLDAGLALLKGPTQFIFVGGAALIFLALTVDVLFHPRWLHSPLFLFYSMNIVLVRYGEVRRKLAPPPDPKLTNPWTDLQPVHSAHWGGRIS